MSKTDQDVLDAKHRNLKAAVNKARLALDDALAKEELACADTCDSKKALRVAIREHDAVLHPNRFLRGYNIGRLHARQQRSP